MEATREGINLAIEQGVWVAMMVDMWAITGKVPVLDEDGKESFLGVQREHMVNTLNFLTDTGFDVGLFGIDVPNPLGFIFSWLRPLKTEMEKTIFEPGEDTFAMPVKFWRPLDPIPRMLVIFMVPAILRLVMNRLGSGGLLGA